MYVLYVRSLCCGSGRNGSAAHTANDEHGPCGNVGPHEVVKAGKRGTSGGLSDLGVGI